MIEPSACKTISYAGKWIEMREREEGEGWS